MKNPRRALTHVVPKAPPFLQAAMPPVANKERADDAAHRSPAAFPTNPSRDRSFRRIASEFTERFAAKGTAAS